MMVGGRGGGGVVGRPPNRILLFTVHDPSHPITTSVLNQVCCGLAYVSRIVVIRKKRADRVQAMLEFESVEDATRIKDHLNGADIYDGCCRLDIEFAYESVYKLKVRNNDDDTWDYTVPDQKRGSISNNNNDDRRGSFGISPPISYPVKRKAPSQFPPEQQQQQYQFGPYHPSSDFVSPGKMARMMSHPPPPSMMFNLPPGPTSNFFRPAGTVLMIYGLNMAEASPRRIFNLLCLYGDVIRIKFLISKDGCAMVEMANPMAAEIVIAYLSGCELFGSEITIRASRQEYIKGSEQSSVSQNPPLLLKNGQPAFCDFSGDNNHRFSSEAQACKSRIVAPCPVLHFYNLPLEEGDKVAEIFTCAGAKKPYQIKLFAKADGARSLNGLAAFASSSDAVDAVAIANHVTVGRNTFKLCFSVNDKIN